MQENILLAGAAKGDITPSKKLMPMPFFMMFKFNRVVDPIYVRVLALSDGAKKCLMVMFEMTCVPNADEMGEFLEKETGIPREYIFLAATHTHEATPIGIIPYENDKRAIKKCELWMEQIKETLLKTVNEALNSMVPAKIGYGTGKSYINVNRDAVFPDGISRLGSNYERPSDKTVRMIRFDDENDNTIALIVNYACHAVVMNGCIVRMGVGITGDLPGRTSQKLEDELKGAVVLWCSGASGDQNPRIMTQYEFDQDKEKPSVKNLGSSGYTVLEWLAREHVRDILQANQSLVCEEQNANLYAAENRIEIEGKEEANPNPSFVLRRLQIGDICLLGVSAEVVTTVGAAIREASPYEKTVLISHANGYEGYIPDDWEFEHKAFECDNSKLKQGVALPALLEGFEKLYQ